MEIEKKYIDIRQTRKDIYIRKELGRHIHVYKIEYDR